MFLHTEAGSWLPLNLRIDGSPEANLFESNLFAFLGETSSPNGHPGKNPLRRSLGCSPEENVAQTLQGVAVARSQAVPERLDTPRVDVLLILGFDRGYRHLSIVIALT